MSIEYKNKWFQVIKEGKFHYLKEHGSNNGAIILLLINDRFVFVKVRRLAHKIDSIEAPRGYGNDNESSELCAIRELYEETGYEFNVSDLKRLGVVRPNSAILSSSIPVFLIDSDYKERDLSVDSEIIELVYISKKEMCKYMVEGEITDGITLSALALYWAKMHQDNN